MVYGAATAGHRVLAASRPWHEPEAGREYLTLPGRNYPASLLTFAGRARALAISDRSNRTTIRACKGGGHGCYHNIVLAPASVQEMCDFVIKAFDLAFKYRNPACILADGVLGHMVEPLKFPETPCSPRLTLRGQWPATNETRGNLVTSIFLNFDELERHNYRLQEKYERIKENEVSWEGYRLEDARCCTRLLRHQQQDSPLCSGCGKKGGHQSRSIPAHHSISIPRGRDLPPFQ